MERLRDSNHSASQQCASPRQVVHVLVSSLRQRHEPAEVHWTTKREFAPSMMQRTSKRIRQGVPARRERTCIRWPPNLLSFSIPWIRRLYLNGPSNESNLWLHCAVKPSQCIAWLSSGSPQAATGGTRENNRRRPRHRCSLQPVSGLSKLSLPDTLGDCAGLTVC